jgi:hypothetical protein
MATVFPEQSLGDGVDVKAAFPMNWWDSGGPCRLPIKLTPGIIFRTPRATGDRSNRYRFIDSNPIMADVILP